MFKHTKPIAEELGIQGIHWHALRHLNNALMMNEGVDVATRMDRLGHVGDQAEVAASEAIERKLEAAQEELEKKQKAECEAEAPPLTVTQTVTQNEGAALSH